MVRTLLKYFAQEAKMKISISGGFLPAANAPMLYYVVSLITACLRKAVYGISVVLFLGGHLHVP